jgi:D-aminoacyl-tRNA deacylase
MESPISRPVIIASREDPASLNIAENLIQKFRFSKDDSYKGSGSLYSRDNISLKIIDELGIFANPEDIPAGTTSLVFASKHVSATGTPALTVHTTGNPVREALFGGAPEQLAFVDPSRIKEALRVLRNESVKLGLQIEVSMEATHHGPTRFEAPVMFIEIGSGPKEWSNLELGEIAAKAVLAAVNTIPTPSSNAVGFGGTHYSAKHTRICLEGNLAVGHLISRHSFDAGISSDVVRQSFDKTVGGCNNAVVDWKGLSGNHRQGLLSLLEEWNIQVERC